MNELMNNMKKKSQKRKRLLAQTVNYYFNYNPLLLFFYIYGIYPN